GAVWASVAILLSRRKPSALRWLAIGWTVLASIVTVAAGWWAIAGLYPASSLIEMLLDASAGLPTPMLVTGAIGVVGAAAITALIVLIARAPAVSPDGEVGGRDAGRGGPAVGGADPRCEPKHDRAE